MLAFFYYRRRFRDNFLIIHSSGTSETGTKYTAPKDRQSTELRLRKKMGKFFRLLALFCEQNFATREITSGHGTLLSKGTSDPLLLLIGIMTYLAVKKYSAGTWISG